MDWANLKADEDRILTKHFTKGRGGKRINKVIVHHNDGDLSVEGAYDVWQTREASAHYQVTSDGTVGQLVWDRDTAWHAGNWRANQTSIGIEHADCSRSPYRISEACLDSGAHLVAAGLMGSRQIRRLPVTENGKLCGMLSLGDLALKEESCIDAGDALTEISDHLSSRF